jgi:hypothetical protein
MEEGKEEVKGEEVKEEVQVESEEVGNQTLLL